MATKKHHAKKTAPNLRHRAVHHAKQMVVPRKANAYRPHLIRRWGLTAVLLTVIGLQFLADVPFFKQTDDDVVLSEQASFSQRELLNESNTVRQRNDVALLKLDPRLNEAATDKARDMIDRDYWAHNAPDGTTPWYWYRQVNYRYDFAAENLAKGFDTPATVIAAWMKSEEHKRNALNPNYEDVGFGTMEGEIDGERTRVTVAMYGSRVGAPSQTDGKVLAAEDGSISVFARLGIGLQSLDPAKLGGLIVLLVTAVVALIAHAFRHRLPKNVRKSWKRHHGLYVAVLLSATAVLLVTLYGQGQIL